MVLQERGYIKKFVLISLSWFVIAGLLGASLRMLFFNYIEALNYQFIVHAHSHVILLGWVFNVLFSAYIFAFISETKALKKKYILLFTLFQCSNFGMLIFFPLEGYALYSITFSTLHVFLSYYFVYTFWKDIKANFASGENTISFYFVKASLVFFLLSSLGPFSLGIIMAKSLQTSQLYQLSIYFYLHFQYNGLFFFGILGLFFFLLEYYKIPFPKQQSLYLFSLLSTSCVFAYSLSCLWTAPSIWVYALGFISVILQLWAYWIFYQLLSGIKEQLKQHLQLVVYYLFVFVFVVLGFKFLLQFASAFPIMADIVYTTKNFIIAYLHLVFLGLISVFLLAWLQQLGFIRLSKLALIVFFLGVLGSEFYIIGQPFLLLMEFASIPYYYQTLFGFSLLIPLGVGIILLQSAVKNNFKQPE